MIAKQAFIVIEAFDTAKSRVTIRSFWGMKIFLRANYIFLSSECRLFHVFATEIKQGCVGNSSEGKVTRLSVARTKKPAIFLWIRRLPVM